ncbi:MAG: ABC transporter permease [Gemmatimonadetes bacterium]|nr:ABC transporter permease [Gemmatimonadota bacterium]
MLKNYIKMALKVLLRRKVFTCISLVTISFTLMVLMVATALFDHVFGSFPPETRSDRTLILKILIGENTAEEKGMTIQAPSYAFLKRYVSPLTQAEKVSISSDFWGTNVTYRNGVKIETAYRYTDGAFWEILEFDFLEGRPYTTKEVEDGQRVVVINEETRRVFFGEEQAVGKYIEFSDRPFRVVGVVSNVPAFRIVPFADIWVPHSAIETDAYQRYERLFGNYQALILASSAAAIPLIKEEFADVLTRIEYPNPDQVNRLTGGPATMLEATARILFAIRDISEGATDAMFFILGLLALLFMLLPVVSLVNINTTRILERASEIGVRKAFGGSSLTLVGQFVVENVILTLLGGALGLVLTFLVLQMLGASDIVPYAEFHLNHRIFFYGLVMTLFFGLLSGIYPAWRMSRLHIVEALRRRKQ